MLTVNTNGFWLNDPSPAGGHAAVCAQSGSDRAGQVTVVAIETRRL